RAGVALDPSPANQVYITECESFIALVSGRLRDARDLNRHIAELDASSGYVYGMAARIDLWLDDVAAATLDRDRFWAGSGHGGAVWATRIAIDAGTAALGGDRQAASLGYRESLRQIR